MKILLLFGLLTFSVHLDANEKPDQLLVYGNKFIFGVKEPQGWKADRDNAWKLGANILFYRSNESFGKKTSFIYIRVIQKIDENITADLKYDMNQYKVKHPEIQCGDIAVSHASYTVYPKLFFIPNKFYEYVTYINPGRGKSLIIRAAMNTKKKEATMKELSAYQATISSLVLLIKP